MKTAINRKNDDFLAIPLKHINRPGTPKLWAITHENGHKMLKGRICFITLNHVNRPRTPKNGQYLMKTAIKCKNDEFLVIPLSHVNLLGTPKLWA